MSPFQQLAESLIASALQQNGLQALTPVAKELMFGGISPSTSKGILKKRKTKRATVAVEENPGEVETNFIPDSELELKLNPVTGVYE